MARMTPAARAKPVARMTPAARAKPAAMRLPMQVWDVPVRLFHWLIVLLVALSYVSIKLARHSDTWMQVHMASGFTILTLLLFRLAWGVVGSDTARFSRFLGSPVAALRHLAAFRGRAADDQIGHNEAGGWMVLLMLALLAAQVGTGLFSNDTGANEGPLAHLVPGHVSDVLSGVHAVLFKVLFVTIVLHVAAVAAYALVKGHDLVRPMITGKKRLLATARAPRMASPLLALALILLAAGTVVLLVTLA